MPSRPSLPDILTTRARLTPDRRAYVFLDEHGAEQAVLTYRDLHERALAVAGRLAVLCRPGDRALLLFPPGLDFIVAYFACLFAQVIAVPVAKPRPNRLQDATLGIIADCEPAAVLTVAAMAGSVRRNLGPPGNAVHWLAVDAVDAAEGDGYEPEPIDFDAVAFLQYTSGSTSAPKGVMVTHRNLIANEEMIQRNFGHDEDSTVVGWAPLYHDQGLIGNTLQPLYVGATSILISPVVFIRRPLLWLTTISAYRAHTSGGPNFGFESCVAGAARYGLPDVDLSCWKVAFNGAEPLRADTLRRFSEAFEPVGFRAEAHLPCYGLAEATLLVSGTGKGRGTRTVAADPEALGQRRFVPAAEGGPSRTLVGSGPVVPGQRARITDPGTGQPSGPGEIGEVWIAGENVALGYWRRPDATAETFGATPLGEDDGPYLRTGDLGLVIDGELYVAGRLKDMIIIRGRNYYPQDIEQTVQAAHPALQPGACAAFGVPGADGEGERLAVVQEMNRDLFREADRADVIGAIREAVAREHEVSLADIVLTMPVQLQKTSSGKVMRAAARKRYLESGFDVWRPKPVRAAVQQTPVPSPS